MDDFRWIGREGEKQFGLLCSRRRVSCNKAEEDDRGWDFIIHYPPSAVMHLPIDQRSMGPKALVQIKTTCAGAERWRISLSNALSLAHSPLPAFIVRVGLDEADAVTFRAVHIWRDELARILMAGRRAHVEGDEQIHRRSVTFDFGPRTERSDVLGWMRAEIDAIGESGYADAKRLLVDTLGFEEACGVASFRVASRSPRAFADLQLGLVDDVALDRFAFTSSRFGLEADTPDLEVRDCRLSLVSPGRRGKLRLRADDGRSELVDAEIFSVTVPGRWRGRTRVKAGFLDLLAERRGRFKARVVEDRAAKVPLSDIAGLALLRCSDRSSPLTVGVRTGRAFNEFGRINTRGPIMAGWAELHSVTRSLRRIVEFEAGQPIITSVDDMSSVFSDLIALDAVVTDAPVRIEFTPIAEREGKAGLMLTYATVSFGDVEIAAVASRRVVGDTMIGERRRIDFGPAMMLHASVNDGRASAMEGLYRDELDVLSERTDVIALGDLRRFIEGREGSFTIDEPRRRALRRIGSGRAEG